MAERLTFYPDPQSLWAWKGNHTLGTVYLNGPTVWNTNIWGRNAHVSLIENKLILCRYTLFIMYGVSIWDKELSIKIKNLAFCITY